MSIWIGAYQAVNDALSAVRGLRNDSKAHGSTRWASLEQLARNLKGAAESIRGLPETDDFVDVLSEMAHRYAERNSATNEELDRDIDQLKLIQQELFRRAHTMRA